MAKNLKLKIKNEQLAQALNLGKIKKDSGEKKSDASETKEVSSAATEASSLENKSLEAKKAKSPSKSISSKEESANAAEQAKKRTFKATDVPSTFKTAKPAAAPAIEDEPSSSPAPIKEKLVESAPYTPKDSLKEVHDRLFKEEIEPLVKEVPKPHVTAAKAPEPEMPVIEKKKEPFVATSKPIDTSREAKADLGIKKEIRPHIKHIDEKEEAIKKAKEPKAAVKKPENQRFDARDRQGLRDSDDEHWRRRRLPKSKKYQEIPIVRPKEASIKLPITVKDLSSALKVKVSDLITKLFLQGIVITINDYLEDETTVQLLGVEFDCDIKIDRSEQEKLRITENSILEEIKKTPAELLKPRPPVVTFMGHVDHGKTSLIDALRKSNIAAGEAGAITQHIGAFRCHSQAGDITVLDTPGHEAFKEMRMRGATVTDIVILVIAGDEGIMPQTDEAIKHAKQANVPILVAINKCDKPAFNTDLVYRQLADHDLLPEAWGGQTITVNCSALTGAGIPQLLEMILLQAEILELKANPTTRARGTVIESQLHKGLGAVANVLIQNGTLKVGDAMVFEDIYGRVKTIHDEFGKLINSAEPSRPVKITGLSGIPEAGCEFIVVENEKMARSICESRLAGEVRYKTFGRKHSLELDTFLQKSKELSEKKVLNLILRADVQGSLEALKNSLMKLPSEKVQLFIISENVGQISESDIELASASNASIIGFHTSVESHAVADISKRQIIVKCHDIIYQLIQDVRQMMLDKLDKIRVETEVGQVLVKAVFKSSHLGLIAGCQVTDGIVKRNHHVKVERNQEVIWEGNISSLKRNKDDVKEVSKGLECGILFDKFRDIQEGDIIRSFDISYQSQDLA